VAQAPWRAASTIGVLVTLTLAASLAVVWLLQWVSRRLFAVPLIAIVLWFFFLWLAFCQRNWHSPIKSSPPS
jgi:MFS superfamily sulfate permease-like transporter